jgi:hypothetical protein
VSWRRSVHRGVDPGFVARLFRTIFDEVALDHGRA